MTDEEIEDVVDKLAGLFMEEMINALATAQKTPEIYAALHKGDTKLTAHEDFNDCVCKNHDKINFLKDGHIPTHSLVRRYRLKK